MAATMNICGAHGFDWRRKIASGPQAIPKLVEIVAETVVEGFNRLVVYTSTSSIRFDSLECLPDELSLLNIRYVLCPLRLRARA